MTVDYFRSSVHLSLFQLEETVSRALEPVVVLDGMSNLLFHDVGFGRSELANLLENLVKLVLRCGVVRSTIDVLKGFDLFFG